LLSAGNITFTYDSNGNTLTKSADHGWVYHYNNANQLIQVDKDQQMVAQYMYIGDGKRIKKIEWSDTLQDYETTIYIYSGEHIVYEENDIGTARHLYGPSGRIAKQTTINNETTTYYYSTDHLGSTRMVTSENGTPLTSVTYYPFGTPHDYTGSEQPFLFSGKEKDATGLYYFNTRYYNPETGRFITRDLYTWLPDDPRSPGTSKTIKKWLMDPQRFDQYSYALNNPLRYTDPTGLSTLVCCDPQCNYICENDDASNSNPGGTEGSPQYSPSESDDEEKDDTEETTEDPDCDAECQRQKAQNECIEKCMEIPGVAEMVIRRNRIQKAYLAWGVGWTLVCLVNLWNPFIAAFCAALAIYAIVDGYLAIEEIENTLTELGCSCVY
jgi:RHS repeat-associated protein